MILLLFCEVLEGDVHADTAQERSIDTSKPLFHGACGIRSVRESNSRWGIANRPCESWFSCIRRNVWPGFVSERVGLDICWSLEEYSCECCSHLFTICRDKR